MTKLSVYTVFTESRGLVERGNMLCVSVASEPVEESMFFDVPLDPHVEAALRRMAC